MTVHRPEDFVRQFGENGLKLLLQGPLNVRDALSHRPLQQVEAIDYDRLQVDPTTYVQRDYRHLNPTWCRRPCAAVANSICSSTS